MEPKTYTPFPQINVRNSICVLLNRGKWKIVFNSLHGNWISSFFTTHKKFAINYPIWTESSLHHLASIWGVDFMFSSLNYIYIVSNRSAGYNALISTISTTNPNRSVWASLIACYVIVRIRTFMRKTIFLPNYSKSWMIEIIGFFSSCEWGTREVRLLVKNNDFGQIYWHC